MECYYELRAMCFARALRRASNPCRKVTIPRACARLEEMMTLLRTLPLMLSQKRNQHLSYLLHLLRLPINQSSLKVSWLEPLTRGVTDPCPVSLLTRTGKIRNNLQVKMVLSLSNPTRLDPLLRPLSIYAMLAKSPNA